MMDDSIHPKTDTAFRRTFDHAHQGYSGEFHKLSYHERRLRQGARDAINLRRESHFLGSTQSTGTGICGNRLNKRRL